LPYDYSGRFNQHKDIFRNSLKSKSCPTEIEGFLFYIMETQEIWKTVPEFEDYQVSNLGRVKSLKFGREKFLNQNKNSDGYFFVGLSNKKKRKKYSIHQLMAIVFLNHVPCGLVNVIDHIDSNPSNNNLKNLRIVTNRFNCTKDRKNIYSSLPGVTFNKNIGKYVSFFKIGKKRYHIGYFTNENEAHNAYLKAVNNYEQFGIIPKTRIKASKYKGVCSTGKGNFYSHIRVEGKTKHLGFFDTESEAFEARQIALKRIGRNF